jgi:hypothetical protein
VVKKEPEGRQVAAGHGVLQGRQLVYDHTYTCRYRPHKQINLRTIDPR